MIGHPSSRGRLICISGHSGSGKDTVGTYLIEQYGFARVAIADPIKHLIMGLFELDPEQLWGDGRNIVDRRLGASPREIYQRFGDVCRAIDPEIWLRKWQSRVNTRLDARLDVVCTDLRTPPELEAARALGGVVWRLKRDTSGAPGSLGTHPTERALDDTPLHMFDEVIENNGPLDVLFRTIEVLMQRPHEYGG
jgi:hypothetical protein